MPILLLGTLLVLGVLVAGAVVVAAPVPEGLLWPGGSRRVFGSAETVRGYVAGFGVWAPLAFFPAHAAQVVVAPFPGGATTVSGPLLFGSWVGTALVVAGGMAGPVVLFALVRRWGRPLAAWIVGRANLERFSGVFDDEKGRVLFVVMLVPLVPDNVAVAAASLSGISPKRFVLLVALGWLPGWLLTALVATELVGRSAATLAMARLYMAVAATIALTYRERLECWLPGPGRRRAPGPGPQE